MTTILKSVLFVDFDSLHLALHARDPLLARRFAARPGLLIEAIEAGTLVRSTDEGLRRRVLVRRLYADPRLIGRAREPFVTQGYQIVDCPTLPGRERNAAEVQITLDTIDALGHATSFDEFILLGAETDFTPLIFRLRAHNRQVALYVPDAAAAAYRAIADGLIEESVLAGLFADLDETAEIAEEEEAPQPAPQREDLAQLARRIHAATNVPLFPPKIYAELFRALTAEIAENGYHFLMTAENVAARLIADGRRASRRQIAFVVKGLALKGHVFSGSDTPEQLAEVFREQVLFLARQAGITIDTRIERQVGAWISGSWASSAPAAQPEPAAPGPAVAEALAEVSTVDPSETQAETSGPSALGAAMLAAVADAISGPAAPDDGGRETGVTHDLAEAEIVAVSERVSLAVLVTAAEPLADGELAPVEATAAKDDAADAQLSAEAEPLPGPVEAIDPAATHSIEPAEAPHETEVIDPVEVGAVAPAVELATAEQEAFELKAEELAAIADELDPAAEAEVAPIEPPFATDASATAARIAPRIRPPGPRNGAAKPSEDLDPFELSLLAAITQSIRPATIEDEAAPSVPAVEPVKPDDKPATAAFDDEIDDEIQRILSAYTQNRKPGT